MFIHLCNWNSNTNNKSIKKFNKKSQQSYMSFSLSSSNTSSTLMKSLKDETFCFPSQNTHASLGQFLVIIIRQSRFCIPSLDHRKLVMTLARLKIRSVSIWDPTNLKIWQVKSTICGNWLSCAAHHTSEFSQSLGSLANTESTSIHFSTSCAWHHHSKHPFQ
jgi:hypothetical protein